MEPQLNRTAVEQEAGIPIGRANQPEDIAAMAVFLASPGARNITGQALQRRWRIGAELSRNPVIARPVLPTAARPALPYLLSGRLPFFYGWVVLACLCCAGFARQGPAVATLSIFVEPLTREFGWSRAALSGAVSLGGVLAALSTPLIGPLLDRSGPRLTLCVAVLVTGVAMLLLSLTQSLLVFYLLFCIARMNWAGPFDLGIYGGVNNWFVVRRAFATSVATVAQLSGLVVMPLIAQLAMRQHGWRGGWLAIGTVTLLIGFLPVCLFMVRRPEDMALRPDGRSTGTS